MSEVKDRGYQCVIAEEVFNRMNEGQGSAGVSSWNDLTDKPFGEEVEIPINQYQGEIRWQEGEYQYGTVYEYNTTVTIPAENCTDFKEGMKCQVTYESVYEGVFERGFEGEVEVDSNGNVIFETSESLQSFTVRAEGNNYILTGSQTVDMSSLYVGTASFTLTIAMSGVKTIDPKYLPRVDIIVERKADGYSLARGTYSEILSAVENGTPFSIATWDTANVSSLGEVSITAAAYNTILYFSDYDLVKISAAHDQYGAYPTLIVNSDNTLTEEADGDA